MASSRGGEGFGFGVYRPGQGIIGKVAATGQPMVFENIDIDRRYQELSYSKGAKNSGFCFFALFPITAKGKFLGTIACLGKEPQKLSLEEIRLITSMSEHIGIAVENIKLFEEVKDKTDELGRSNAELREALEQQTATSEILRVIASSPTDIQPVLDTVAECAARLCDSQDAQIYQVDGEMMRKVARYGTVPDGIPLGSTRPISRGSNTGRAIVDRQTNHIHDMLAEREEDFADV